MDGSHLAGKKRKKRCNLRKNVKKSRNLKDCYLEDFDPDSDEEGIILEGYAGVTGFRSFASR